MSEPERWTIGRLLQWTTDYLKKGGSASPRLDAEILLADARGCERIQLYTAFDEDPGETVRTRFREAVKRRASGEPVAYLVGRREFYSLMFEVTPDVLVPRPETEFVVIAILDAAKQWPSDPANTLRIADVGTGSGAIAVSVAKHLADASITATDVSAAALAVARKNAERHNVSDRIEFLEGNLLQPVPDDRQFEIIASNPPYITAAEMRQLPRDVREFEPTMALLGGEDGLDIIRQLVDQSTRRLVPGGSLIVEIGASLEGQVRTLFSDANWKDVRVIKDLAGLPRVVTAVRAGG